MMRTSTAVLASLLLLAACGSEEPTHVHDANVTFLDEAEATEPFTITLFVRKPGRTSITHRTEPREGEISGRHNFPPHVAGPAIAAYYLGLLNNAGWEHGTDFEVEGATIRFRGVSEAAAGSNTPAIKATTVHAPEN
jgi:hypothetical protein